jgi:DNA-binding MarR family transcriptional regulator
MEHLHSAEHLAHLFDRMSVLSRSPAFVCLMQLNLGISHVKALHHIAKAGEVPMKDLAELLAMTPPSVTALVRRLEQTGLVERSQHASDSRVRLLRLTDEGQHLADTLRQQRLHMMAQLLATLDVADQRMLLDLLERAITAAESLIDAERPKT